MNTYRWYLSVVRRLFRGDHELGDQYDEPTQREEGHEDEDQRHFSDDGLEHASLGGRCTVRVVITESTT